MFLLGVGARSRGGDALGVVREVGARAPAAQAVFGAVPGALECTYFSKLSIHFAVRTSMQRPATC